MFCICGMVVYVVLQPWYGCACLAGWVPGVCGALCLYAVTSTIGPGRSTLTDSGPAGSVAAFTGPAPIRIPIPAPGTSTGTGTNIGIRALCHDQHSHTGLHRAK